jgi:phage baseplate assembly protein W
MSDESKAFLGQGWAFPIRLDQTGEVSMVTYEQDVRQAIRIILSTAQGERVMRPDFGAGLERLLFEPINTTTMALVKHRVEQALIRWEPRIDVEEVSVAPDTEEMGKLLIDIRYRVRRTNTFYNLVYPFYLQERQEGQL